MSIAKIGEIKSYQPPAHLQIRAIKKWIPFTRQQDLCYLFVDIHGDAIKGVADSREQSYFDSQINIQSCYDISNCIAIPARKVMPSVPHTASVRLGKITLFTPLDNIRIPSFYFNFIHYDMLESRSIAPKKLTADYIGRLNEITPVQNRKDNILRKATLQDDRKNVIVVTFWNERIEEIAGELAIGDMLAVIATLVTKFKVGINKCDNSSGKPSYSRTKQLQKQPQQHTKVLIFKSHTTNDDNSRHRLKM